MHIRLVRTGGLTGLRRAADVDTETLEPSRAARMRRLVEVASLEGIVPASEKRARGPDRFRYTLTIEEGGREHTVEFVEEEVPESVHRLVEALWNEAEPGSPPDSMKRV